MCMLHKCQFLCVLNLILQSEWGIGYAWLPRMLTVEAGDTVCFEWEAPKYILDVPRYRVVGTPTATSTEYDESGLHSGEEGTSTGEAENNSGPEFSNVLKYAVQLAKKSKQCDWLRNLSNVIG